MITTFMIYFIIKLHYTNSYYRDNKQFSESQFDKALAQKLTELTALTLEIIWMSEPGTIQKLRSLEKTR